MAVSRYMNKNGKFKFRADYWVRSKKIASQSFDRKFDADNWMRTQSLSNRKLRSKFGRTTFDEYYKEVYRGAKDIRLSTRKEYDSVYQCHLKNHFGRQRLQDIEFADWDLFKEELLENEMSKPRINRIQTVFSSVLKLAVKKRHLDCNPIQGTGYFKEYEVDLEYWTGPQIHFFLDSVKDSRWRLFFRTGFELGLRIGELIALEKTAVDKSLKQIRIRQSYSSSTRKINPWTKNGRIRSLGISGQLCSLLHGQQFSDGLLFRSNDGGPIRYEHARSKFYDFQNELGLPGIRLHGMRHSFAASFLANGGSLYDLKQLLGHSDIKTTERYAHFQVDEMAAKSRVFDFDSLGLTHDSPIESSLRII